MTQNSFWSGYSDNTKSADGADTLLYSENQISLFVNAGWLFLLMVVFGMAVRNTQDNRKAIAHSGGRNFLQTRRVTCS